MSIVENNRLKQYACYWHTKSNFRKISSYCGGIMSALASTEFMGKSFFSSSRVLISFGILVSLIRFRFLTSATLISIIATVQCPAIDIFPQNSD